MEIEKLKKETNEAYALYSEKAKSLVAAKEALEKYYKREIGGGEVKLRSDQ